jgi:GNAT superfamily N-acetyltransferase
MDDLDRCARLADVVHRRDGYPPYLPTDLGTFLASPDALTAWVAECDGEIVGHVALHRHTSAAALALAARALGRPADRLGVIARLLVAPASRRGGLGRALLEAATEEAWSRDLWPMLDVATQFGAAVKLYEDSGWVKAGQVTFRADVDTAFEEFVYLAPPRRRGPDDDAR